MKAGVGVLTIEGFAENVQNFILHEFHQGQGQLEKQREAQTTKEPQFCVDLKCSTT